MEKNLEFIPKIAFNWYNDGKKVALATVINTWGSSPRPVGSQLVVSSDREFMGSVSGGCVEGAVIEIALESIEKASCQIVEFGVSNEIAFSAGLPCGGSIKIMIEPIGLGNGVPIELLEKLNLSVSLGESCTLVTDTISKERLFFKNGKCLLGDCSAKFKLEANSVSEELESGLKSNLFVNVYRGNLKLIIIGAVHIAQFLVQIGKLAGYEITLIDPRQAFCLNKRFSCEKIINEWPDEALKHLKIDNSTAVVMLAHDPKLDDSALYYALNSDAFYIGCLGSKKNHANRVERLKFKGFSQEKINKIHAPVGLDIGARTPAEIAISIMSEITLKLRII